MLCLRCCGFKTHSNIGRCSMEFAFNVELCFVPNVSSMISYVLLILGMINAVSVDGLMPNCIQPSADAE